MSFINENNKEINCKIVYYGPALAGKSTTLRHIYDEVKLDSKGKMISLEQDDDRTLYFDFVPLNLGKVGDYMVRLHLYTIPGEVGYQQSRTLISRGLRDSGSMVMGRSFPWTLHPWGRSSRSSGTTPSTVIGTLPSLVMLRSPRTCQPIGV